MNLQPHTVYTGRSTNWPSIVLTTALVVPLVAMAVTGDGSWTALGVVIPLGVVVGAALVNLLTATSVRTTAGPKGVTVNFGVFGRPRFRYAIDRIERAEVITIPSSQWAWGIYWSPRRGLMLTLRTGTALRLTLTNGRRVTISTPLPEVAVQALDRGREGDAGHLPLNAHH